MKKTLIVLMVLVWSFSAIFASTQNSWIQNPPADTQEYFYAIGYGETQKEAKNDALSTISAKISVDLSSNFSNLVTATREGNTEDVSATTKSEIKTKSKEIQYTDVQILKSYNDAKQWIVLVVVDKDSLVATYERKLDTVDDKIKAEWEVFQGAGIFQKLKLSLTINKYLQETDNIFSLLHALKKGYDDSKYKQRYLNYIKEMRKAKDQLLVKIVSDYNSEPLASLIQSELSAQNVKFNNTNYNVIINITTKAKKRKYLSTNDNFAKLTFALRKTTIKITDKEGNILSSKTYKTRESSPDGFEDAIAKTTKYEKKINQKGIIAFITGE